MAATEPLLDPMMRTMTFDHVVPGRYVPTATIQAGGASLDWVAEVLRPDDPAKFSRLLAEAADADTSGLYFLPHLLGERSPHWNAAAAGAFLGLERHHGSAELTRAVLEGVAFNLATCVSAFREAGHPVQRVDAIGGGAASDLWLQILADMWGATGTQADGRQRGEQPGRRGHHGGRPRHGRRPRRGPRTVAGVGRIHPTPDRTEDYRQRHAVYLDAYRRLEPWFDSR